jgi:hypothetical protein
VTDRESAIDTPQKENGRLVGATLKDDEVKRFQDLGMRIGAEAFEVYAETAKNAAP